MSIINLPGWSVTGSKANKDDYRLSATYDGGAEMPVCPKCTTLFGRGHQERVIQPRAAFFARRSFTGFPH